METVWIQIFLLSFAECVAPVGKTVCQEQQFELKFLTRNDCEYALQQMIAMKADDEHVIVNHEKSVCSPSAAETESYADRAAINSRLQDSNGWRESAAQVGRQAAVNTDHRERLAELKKCEDTNGNAPCKIGEIIVEDASGDKVGVWKRD